MVGLLTGSALAQDKPDLKDPKQRASYCIGADIGGNFKKQEIDIKGHAVERIERVHIDTGWVILTSKNIYFAGSQKSLRLPYKKIVSFEPYSDGMGIMRDAATAKTQVFVTGDGWFTYNAVINLAQL